MSQEMINSITKLTRAIEALAERVTKLEQPPIPTPMMAVPTDWPAPSSLNDHFREQIAQAKRGPGRPRKDAHDADRR